MSSIPERIIRKVRREGVRAGLRAVRERAQRLISLDETHFWYELSLSRGAIEKLPMPLGASLRPGTVNDLDLIERIPSVSVEEAMGRLERGNQLWIALLEGRPAFSCWIFHGSVPILAAPGGEMPLPPRVVMLEDSVALPGVRSRGLANCTINNVVTVLQKSDCESVITRVKDDNVPAQKLVQKLGFKKTTSNRYKRSGLSRYESVSGDDTSMTRWIAKQLEL